MMLVVSIMMLNVEDMTSDEDRELIPIVYALLNSAYFSQTGQAMATILFGDAKSDMTNLLRNISLGISSNSARCLQYLCITVFYERVALSFVEHYNALNNASTSLCTEYSKNNKGKESKFSTALQHYQDKVFGAFYETEDRGSTLIRDDQRTAFQVQLGYSIYTKFLLPRMEIKESAGMSKATIAKPKSIPAGKRKSVSASKKSKTKGKSKSPARVSNVATKETETHVEHSSSSPVLTSLPVSKRQKLSTDATGPNLVNEMFSGVAVALQSTIVRLVKDLTEDIRNANMDLQLKYDDLRLKFDDSVGELRSQIRSNAEQNERNAQQSADNFTEMSRMLMVEFSQPKTPESVATLKSIQTQLRNNTNSAFDAVEETDRVAVAASACVEEVQIVLNRPKKVGKVARKTVLGNAVARTAVNAIANGAATSKKRKDSNPREHVSSPSVRALSSGNTMSSAIRSTVDSEPQEVAIERTSNVDRPLPPFHSNSDEDSLDYKLDTDGWESGDED